MNYLLSVHTPPFPHALFFTAWILFSIGLTVVLSILSISHQTGNNEVDYPHEHADPNIRQEADISELMHQD